MTFTPTTPVLLFHNNVLIGEVEMNVRHHPQTRAEITSNALFNMAFDRDSYAAIYSRFGTALDIARRQIQMLPADLDNHAEHVQAIIDQTCHTLTSFFAGIDLPWLPPADETPFWQHLVIDARNHLEAFADHTIPKAKLRVVAPDDSTDVTTPAEEQALADVPPSISNPPDCC